MKKYCVTILFLSLCISLISQKITRKEYINKYYQIAVREMQNYGIPASITMAQGILESGNGNTYLAIEANNHFGIKCHEWTGPTVLKDDDKKNECFRKYFDAEDSFKDHSIFLSTRKRYAFLFDLKPDDYKGWSKGLKKAGYATDPKYPSKLIKIIEENELYLLDKYALSNKPEKEKLPPAISPKAVKNEVVAEQQKQKRKKKQKKNKTVRPIPKDILTSENGIPYIIIQKDITYSEIAEKYQIHLWEIYKFNDLSKDVKKPELGERVYLDYKRLKKKTGKLTHTVVSGETMREISQQYGIRLKSLYKINKMNKGTQAQAGKVIKLNNKAEIE